MKFLLFIFIGLNSICYSKGNFNDGIYLSKKSRLISSDFYIVKIQDSVAEFFRYEYLKGVYRKKDAFFEPKSNDLLENEKRVSNYKIYWSNSEEGKFVSKLNDEIKFQIVAGKLLISDENGKKIKLVYDSSFSQKKYDLIRMSCLEYFATSYPHLMIGYKEQFSIQNEKCLLNKQAYIVKYIPNHHSFLVNSTTEESYDLETYFLHLKKIIARLSEEYDNGDCK